jgi:LppX_LprAFG lipoprotein
MVNLCLAVISSESRIPMMRPSRWVAGSILAFLLTACGGKATPLPSAEEVLQRCAQALQKMQTTHFILERSGAPSYIDESHTLNLERMEGDVQTPDRAKASVRVAGPAMVFEIQIVTIGEAWWQTNPLTGAWESSTGTGYNPATFLDPETGLAYVLSKDLTGLTLIGLEKLEDFPGERFFHLTAEAPGEGMAAITGGLIGLGRLEIDLWILPETYYPARMRLVDTETDPNDPTVWVLDLDHFDAPVTIEAPTP